MATRCCLVRGSSGALRCIESSPFRAQPTRPWSTTATTMTRPASDAARVDDDRSGNDDDNQRSTVIKCTYRTLARFIQALPENKREAQWTELRESYRAPLSDDSSVDSRLHEAGKKIAFLRIMTPKAIRSNGVGGSQRWVYRDGKAMPLEDSGNVGSSSRVVSNWDGNNLDPCSVKRHKVNLRRAGFVNNLHAKGLF